MPNTINADQAVLKLFMQELVNATTDEKTKVVKGYISDFGNLGVLFIEGAGRNPRVDDLQAFLYAEALHNKDIAEWLGREADATSNSTLFAVGVGCSTETKYCLTILLLYMVV